MRPSPNGFWLPVCIAKVIGIPDHWFASLPRLAFEGLELCDGKLSRTVLRGLGAGNSPRLPGFFTIAEFHLKYTFLDPSFQTMYVSYIASKSLLI